MTVPFADVEYKKHKDRRDRRNRPKSRPSDTQQAKNLYEKGQRLKFTLLNGQSFEGTIVKQSTYELKVWRTDGPIVILPKHSILLAEVKG